jgi:hypothetical protein
MPKRLPDCEDQIATAREMPANWQAGTGAGRGPNGAKPTEQCRNAEAPAEAHPGAPSKLPAYGTSQRKGTP